MKTLFLIAFVAIGHFALHTTCLAQPSEIYELTAALKENNVSADQNVESVEEHYPKEITTTGRQDSLSNLSTSSTWLSLGIGASPGLLGSQIGLSHKTKTNHYLGIKFSAFEQMSIWTGSGSSSKSGDFLLGKVKDKTSRKFYYFTGLSYVTVEKTRENQSTGKYEETKSTIGLPVGVGFIASGARIGVDIQLMANINPQLSYGALMISLGVGDFR